MYLVSCDFYLNIMENQTNLEPDLIPPIVQSLPVTKKWHQKIWGRVAIAMVALILILVIAVGVLIFMLVREGQQSSADIGSQLAASAKSQSRQIAEKLDRPSFGNKDAKLVIVEFGDFQCPISQTEFPIIREISNRYQDKILFIYRQFPVINQNSILAAQASLCANEQGKFWAMHDRLFSSTGQELTTEFLSQVAKSSGVDLVKFQSCLSSEKYKNQVTEDALDAELLAVAGTPTFFVNGYKLEGAISKAKWEEILTKAAELLK